VWVRSYRLTHPSAGSVDMCLRDQTLAGPPPCSHQLRFRSSHPSFPAGFSRTPAQCQYAARPGRWFRSRSTCRAGAVLELRLVDWGSGRHGRYIAAVLLLIIHPARPQGVPPTQMDTITDSPGALFSGSRTTRTCRSNQQMAMVGHGACATQFRLWSVGAMTGASPSFVQAGLRFP
jgi:hypothetical protein